ncbi:MAG: hypothetical protein H6867_06155 [Rhodospirillales bacterium]|nr:hypothetical protein [Rhodospirillales bacterium]MCB9995112.1 hypothetical protein [Rhodospirillales bacterium]
MQKNVLQDKRIAAISKKYGKFFSVQNDALVLVGQPPWNSPPFSANNNQVYPCYATDADLIGLGMILEREGITYSRRQTVYALHHVLGLEPKKRLVLYTTNVPVKT